MTDWIQITLRILHIFLGVFWAGTVFFLSRFLLPAIRSSGSAGDIVSQELVTKQKLAVAVPIAALTTVLTGAALYWRNISMSNGAWAHSRAASVMGLGGFTGLVALIVGATMIGPSFEAISKIQNEAKSAGAALTTEQTAKIAGLHRRLATAARIGATGLFITVITMAIGRYL